METKFVAPSAIALVLAFGILTAGNAYAQTATWYVGEGTLQNTYVTYRIQEIQTNDSTPYELTIYFKEQDDRGAWIAPSFVVSEGKVIPGTLRLADNNLTPLGGGEVSAEMQPYISGYQNSMTFLEAYASKSNPKALSGNPWGNVAGTGAAVIGPTGSETVTVGGGTFDTSIISYSRGNVVNKIWVADNFPYPVKALVYADVTEPPAPIRYQFELLKQGEGQPETPQSTEEIPQPPLKKSTVTSRYQVQVSWDPVTIEPGKETTFTISFYDNQGFPVENVGYDFVVTDADGNTLAEETNELARLGVAEQKITFESGGGKSILVTVNSVSGVGTGDFVESADFNIVVVPEFPVSALIVAGAVISLVVLMTRFRSTSFGSMFGNRNAL
ncbi:MAG: hypothetical protein QXJ74_01310 [Nitrososphaera sp.]|uniref:hypothetical protein n=1 Tax=Nitrososphaera sp. TaxID=1971748 RepID=UPI0017E3E445|nr:hypothetical protein [Nitrososphaera sp.]NWG38181.1 hypothetical protein [Nitrososphaera sp.]